MLNEEDKNALSLFNTYRVEQLIQEPDYTYIYSGNPIECTYNSETRTFDVGFKVFTLRIPSNYTVIVNGTEITGSENWLAEKNQEITELKNIPGGAFCQAVYESL